MEMFLNDRRKTIITLNLTDENGNIKVFEFYKNSFVDSVELDGTNKRKDFSYSVSLSKWGNWIAIGKNAAGMYTP